MSKMPTFKHIQYARDDIMQLAKRLNDLVTRVTALEASIGKKK
jgi:hypothetical protein